MFSLLKHREVYHDHHHTHQPSLAKISLDNEYSGIYVVDERKGEAAIVKALRGENQPLYLHVPLFPILFETLSKQGHSLGDLHEVGF